MGVTPSPDKEAMVQLKCFARKIAKRLPRVIPDRPEQMATRYTGAKRARYALAAQRLLAEGVSRKDATVSMFVKMEKLNPVKVNPDCRAIQFRTPKYCVAIGQYLKPLEHIIYELSGDGKLLPPDRLIGKGLNQTERAELLVKKWHRFDRPVVVGIDATRFDKHIHTGLLEVEQIIYNAMVRDRTFARYMSWQMVNKGRTRSGVKYTVRGKRMSGDMNTALGNCLIMVICVAFVLHGIKYDLLDDGDDLLILCEDKLLCEVQQRVGRLLSFGLVVKAEAPERSLPEVNWCQSNPIEVMPGKWRFIRHPTKAFACALGGSKYMESSLKLRKKLVNSIGLCELVLNSGVPVLQEFAVALIRNAATTETLKFDSIDSMYYRVMRETALPMAVEIHPSARDSFMAAFGVTPQDQVDMELRLRNWSFSLQGDVAYPCDIDKISWKRPFGIFTPEIYHL
jgi:hypothetical protein